MLARRINGTCFASDMRNEVDRLFGGVFDAALAVPSVATAVRTYAPAVDIVEDDDGVVVQIEVPGLAMEDLDVVVKRDRLEIAGTPSDEKLADGEAYLRRERRFGSFRRVFTLSVEIDAAAVKADLRNGVLTVTLPKAAAAKPRKIEVSYEKN